MSNNALVVRAAEQSKHWLLTELVTPLLRPEHTGGRYSITHAVVRNGCGSPPHVHRREDEGFYIIDGEMTFLYGDTMLVAGPGSFVWAPRDVPHNFTATSVEPVKALILSTPTGFDRFAAGFMRPAADANDWPALRPQDIDTVLRTAPDFGIEMLPGHPMPATIRRASTAGKRLWVMGERVSYLATSAQTGGAFTVVEIETVPAGGPMPHVHEDADEVFYVIDGRHEFVIDDATVTAGPGDLVYAPRGSRHAFGNVGDTTGKLLSLHTPGGFEAFFDEVGIDGDARPVESKIATSASVTAELLARHGTAL